MSNFLLAIHVEIKAPEPKHNNDSNNTDTIAKTVSTTITITSIQNSFHVASFCFAFSMFPFFASFHFPIFMINFSLPFPISPCYTVSLFILHCVYSTLHVAFVIPVALSFQSYRFLMSCMKVQLQSSPLWLMHCRHQFGRGLCIDV